MESTENPEEIACPVCKTDRYLNPNMILLVSPCYHKMCEACVSRIFGAGSAPCPICRMTLRKSNFVKPTFESMYVEKECQVRKRIAKIFNKRLEDFDGDLLAFNNYLEEVEELVFNLVNDCDVQNMNARIEAYREQNSQLIQKNSELMAEEKHQLETILKEEAQEFHARKREDHRLMQQEVVDRDLKQRQIMNDLGSSEADVSTILSRHSKNDVPTTVDQQERGSSLLLKLSKLSKGSGVKADAHQRAIKNPLESPFTRVEIPLPSKYRDPYASAQIGIVSCSRLIETCNTERHRAAGFTIQITVEKSISRMLEGLFVEKWGV